MATLYSMVQTLEKVETFYGARRFQFHHPFFANYFLNNFIVDPPREGLQAAQYWLENP